MSKKFDNPFLMTRVSPSVKAIWVHLERPDTRFDSEGKYTVTCAYPIAEAEKLEAGLNSLRAAAVADLERMAEKYNKTVNVSAETMKTPKFKRKTVGPEEEGNRAGPPGTEYAEVEFKVKATGKRNGVPVSNKPSVVDARKQPVSEPVFGGSTLKIAFRVVPYAGFGGGMSLRLLSVQVLELVSGGGYDPTNAFEEEEGGFESDGDPAQSFSGGDDQSPPAEGGDPADF